MSDTKQFVYKLSDGSLGTASQTENYYIYSITPTDESVDDSGTNTLSIYDSDGAATWSIQSYNNIEGINTPGGGAGSTENFATTGPNYISSGLRGLECDLDNRDPRQAYNAQLPATKCKAVVTGQYVPKLFLTHEVLNGYHTTPISFTMHYTEVGKSGGGNSDFTQTISSSDFNSTIVADSPLDGDGGATITFTSQGSGVTGGELTGHTGKKWQLDWTAPGGAGNWGKVSMRLEPIGNPGGAYEPHIFFKGTVVRSWEGNLYNINGSGGDDAVNMSTSATVTATGAYIHSGASAISSAFTITEDTENFKIAPATTLSSTSTVATTTLFKLGDTLTLPTTTNLIGSMNPLEHGEADLSSAFTFEIDGIVVNAGSTISSTFTTTIQGNIISDITGDYTWNSLSNNPFVDSGYVKGGYTDDAEYEWDDLLSSDGSADATWDTWTYGTWLGDETSWDSWPRDVWTSPFTMEIKATQADTTPLLKHGGISTISSAFTISTDPAFRILGEASLSSAFACEASAPGLYDGKATISSAFTLAVSDVDFLENILQSELPITAAFTTSFTGSIKYALDEEIAISSAMTFSLGIIKLIYGIDETPPSIFTADFTGSIKYGSDDVTLSVLASKVSVGALLTQADPYNIITVDAETRTFVVPAESRLAVVQEENRLNIISSETRLENVLEETRVHKLKIPGLTNIYSTPRVRSET